MTVNGRVGSPAGQHDSDEMETTSSASAGTENYHDTPSRAERRAFKKAVKHDRSLKKSAKNEERHTVSIRQSDIDRIAKALHGDSTDTCTGSGHPLATDKVLEEVIERNRRFVANIEEHKSYLRSSVASARRATNGPRRNHRGSTSEADATATNEDAEELVNAVLLQLGIDTTVGSGKRRDRSGSFCSTPPAKMATVMAKLRAAIHEDIEKHENEQRDTCIRAGGFWRYCGRPVFDRMTAVARTIDWRTGQILKKQKEEGAELEEGDG